MIFGACSVMQLCIWSVDGWEKKKARPIQVPPGHQGPLVGETRVQFHNDQSHILVVHESQIGIYDTQLECLRAVRLHINLLYFVFKYTEFVMIA